MKVYVRFLQETHSVIELLDNGSVITDGCPWAIEADAVDFLDDSGNVIAKET